MKDGRSVHYSERPNSHPWSDSGRQKLELKRPSPQHDQGAGIHGLNAGRLSGFRQIVIFSTGIENDPSWVGLDDPGDERG